jgi:Fungal protein kinase
MAIEIMLKSGQLFCHDLHHDLESVLYVIIWVCTHMNGVESECQDLDDLDVGLRQLGLVKLSHMAAAKLTILTQFAEYWVIMKPFILDLITTTIKDAP